jgi:hypothetical protein
VTGPYLTGLIVGVLVGITLGMMLADQIQTIVFKRTKAAAERRRWEAYASYQDGLGKKAEERRIEKRENP